MNNRASVLFMYFIVPFSLVIVFGLLTGCASGAGQYEKRANNARAYQQSQFDKDYEFHRQWVECVKRREMDSFGVANGTCI